MIAEKIKALRQMRGITQSDLAKELGLSRNGVNSWEQGLSTPSTAYIVELAKLFNVSTDYLLDLSTENAINVTGLSTHNIALLSELASNLKRIDK